jgi:predicted HTH domain antitoxin
MAIEFPDHCLPPNQDTKALAKKIKLYGAILLFQSGQLSRGAACEFAGVDIYTFFAACKENKISISNIDPDDIEADLNRFDKLHSS